MMQEDEGLSQHVTARDSGCNPPTILPRASDCLPVRPWGRTHPCNEADGTKGTRRFLPPSRCGITPHPAAFQRSIPTLPVRLFTPNSPRESRIFNLGSRESGRRGGGSLIQCTAKIKHRGPGAGRCVFGHQPRCASAIRLTPPFVLPLNARGGGRVRIRGSTSS